VPTPLDIAFALLFAVVLAGADSWYFARSFRRRVAAGVPNARRNAYRRTLVGEWLVAALALLLWARERRKWSDMGLAIPHGWRLLIGTLMVGLTLGIVLRQNAAVRRLSDKRRAKAATQFGDLEFMMPRTPNEHRWFIALSWTAGICEELLYRGFLTWLVAAYLGWLAVPVVAVLFGVAHAYQGRTGILNTGVVGLLMGLIVLASGSLIPAMVIHALIDVSGGSAGYAVLGSASGDVIRSQAA
jgi:membrane protease YdiL (CAAX protease family)